MEYFTVLILCSFLAAGSSADDAKRESKVDMRLLTNAYLQAAERTEIPIGGYNELMSNFKKQYVQLALIYGQTLMNYTYSWGLERGEELINAASNRSYALKKCIKSVKNCNNEPSCLEYALEDLTKQFHIFLRLFPDEIPSKFPPLPNLPPQPTKIRPIPKLSANDIFVNLTHAINEDLQNFYDIALGVHFEGWRALRPNIRTVQMQFRDQILYGRVLVEYRSIVHEILEFANFIEHHVNLELWESFKTACARIIAISNDYNEGKKDTTEN